MIPIAILRINIQPKFILFANLYMIMADGSTIEMFYN
jgi:hypothetical protein